MLTTLQILSILQGVFLGVTLFQRRNAYKKPIFRLFIGCIASIILFSIGDDDYNLLVSNSRWFFFQEPLLITFFFLFIRYIHAEKNSFDKRDYLFFAPYFLYILLEIASNSFPDNSALDIGTDLIELSFALMLAYSIYEIVQHEKNKWLLLFIIPLTLIYTIDTTVSLFIKPQESFLLLDSYGIFLVATFLFYFVTYKLVLTPKAVLPLHDPKYKSSTLSKAQISSIKKELNGLMAQEKLFKNQKLSVNEVASRIGISRQQLSEVLNIHMGLRFQDYLNQYRVEEFIRYLKQEEYQHFTLMGIATEAGFSSKSSFNATFKKVKGMTPSQYKKENTP